MSNDNVTRSSAIKLAGDNAWKDELPLAPTNVNLKKGQFSAAVRNFLPSYKYILYAQTVLLCMIIKLASFLSEDKRDRRIIVLVI